MNNFRKFLYCLIAFAATYLTACAPLINQTDVAAENSTPTAAAAQIMVTENSVADPFAYCAAVGSIDKPDARYSGPKITDAIIKGYLKAAGLDPNTPFSDQFRKMTIWRCMDQKVYACNFGANLPCDSKANTDKTPTQAMADFCKDNLNADFIPMYVTGHTTIYSWHCVKDTPALLDQIEKVDAAGYLSEIWYAISPAP